MLSARGWARSVVGAIAFAVLGIVACEEDDAVFSPLDDTTEPVVSITDAVSGENQLTVTVQAEDFISVSFVVTELRDPNQLVTEITPEGDTLTLGRLLAVDTTRFSGQATNVTVNTTFQTFFSQATIVDIRAVAQDPSENTGVDEATVVVGGGETGGLGAPIVSIFSPLPNQTVRDNTLIRVGVQATDPIGLAQLNVLLTGVTTVPQADTIRFAEFRSDVDTLLDFFIPSGNLGTLTISAEAVNINSISAFASIMVTVAQEVSDDSIPPSVSMVVSGGVQRRLDEAPRMEVDDSLIVDVVANDQETAVTRVGVTYAIKNATVGGDVADTIFQDSLLSPAVSGTVPIRFVLVPEVDLIPPLVSAGVFDANTLPDTLFFEITAWAFDAASPAANCGATVDVLGSSSSLQCTSGDPVRATGLSGGFVDRLVVGGRTVGFPQGSLIADAVVDTLRQVLLLADQEFGLVRPFDLVANQFLGNIPVGSEPWGMTIDNSQDSLMVANSGGTNISVIDLGPRSNPPALGREENRYQTQDLQVFQVFEDFDAFGFRIYPVFAFDFSDRPQFVAQAANDLVLFSTKPAVEDDQPGTIREYDTVQQEIRFFISYAERVPPSTPQIQVINADSVFGVSGGRSFKICDHERGNRANVDCVFVDAEPPEPTGFEEADSLIAFQTLNEGWDVLIFTDLSIGSIGLQDTTFVTASGDREFIAFGEGDTEDRPGRIIMYESATQTITNSLMVSDLTENAAQGVFGLALDRDGRLGVGRGEVAFFFGPDVDGGPNVLRLLGINDDIQITGTGAAIHPDHITSTATDAERLSFLGSGDARLEIVDTKFFSFKRGDILIRDPVVGPLRITKRLPGDPLNVAVRLYGVTENGVVVITVLDSDIDPLP